MAQAQKKAVAQPQRPKHIPQRMCVACRRSDAKRGLVRIVREEGRVVIDLGGKRQGRGAYLCREASCWEQALRRHSLERALNIEQITDEDQALLRQFTQDLAAD